MKAREICIYNEQSDGKEPTMLISSSRVVDPHNLHLESVRNFQCFRLSGVVTAYQAL